MVFKLSQTGLPYHTYSFYLFILSFIKHTYQSPQVFLISTNTAVPHISSLMVTKAKLIPARYPRHGSADGPRRPSITATHTAQQGADDKRMKCFSSSDGWF